MVAATVSSRIFDDTTIIVLRGRVDATGSDQLRRELIDALMRREPRRIVIDLAQATSLDATAMGALIAAHETAPAVRRTLTLSNPSTDLAAELAEHGLSSTRAAARPC